MPQAYYPLNYQINYFGTVYTFNVTELAWLCALLQGANKVYTKLDAYNTDLQALMHKGLVTSTGTLTREGILLATYVYTVHTYVKENPIFSLTYDFITTPDTIGINMKAESSEVEPKYNFQKRLKKFFERQAKTNESFDIQSEFAVVETEDLIDEMALAVTPMKPFPNQESTDSSFLKAFAYNDDTEELDVHMKDGKIYRYSEVPSLVFTALKTANGRLADYGVKLKSGADMKEMSVGSYYSKLISKKYPAIRIA